MTTKNSIEGSWYIKELNQQEKNKPNAVLVLNSNRVHFDDNTKNYLENLPEISALGSVQKGIFIYEKPVDYWIPLSDRKLHRRPLTLDEEIFDGIGNLGTSKYSYNGKRLITPQVSDELMKTNALNPHHTQASLYVVRFRDANDRDTNPFHQTGVIAIDESDVHKFMQGFGSFFNKEYRTIDEIFDQDTRIMKGIVVMPEVIANFQKE